MGSRGTARPLGFSFGGRLLSNNSRKVFLWHFLACINVDVAISVRYND